MAYDFNVLFITILLHFVFITQLNSFQRIKKSPVNIRLVTQIRFLKNFN